jgi:hypothetical protein
MNTNLQELDQFNELTELDQQEEPPATPTAPRSVPFAAVSKVKHIQAPGVYIKATFVHKGVKFYTKSTPDSHISILAHGEILKFETEDQKTRYRAPRSYQVPANSRIAFYTLTDCVFYCVHATDETNIDTLDRIY